METTEIVLVEFAVLAAVIALGSYYIHQWFASNGWRSAMPWFASGLAFALIMASVGFAILEIMPMPTDSHFEDSRPRLVGSPIGAHSRKTHASVESEQIEPATRTHNRQQSSRAFAWHSDDHRAPAEEISAGSAGTLRAGTASDEAASASVTTGVSHQVWLEDVSFWGATRCVLAIRLDPEDPATWTLINDCGVDVRILVATCASALEECRQRRSVSWSYVPNGVSLPAKVKRSVTLEEQTVHGLHLRYAACRSNGSMNAQPVDDRSGTLRHVGVESCDEEVRSLSREGAQSGSQIEEIVNEPIPTNPCCDRLQ